MPSDLKKEDKIVNSKRSFHNLITYLNQKCAAGVVSLPDDNKPTASLNIFTPNCGLSAKLVKQLVPGIRIDLADHLTGGSSEELNYLVIILLKTVSS